MVSLLRIHILQFVEMLRFEIKIKLDSFPSVYIFLQKVKHYNSWYKSVIVNRNSDVVIEGYPRCANSFAQQAFRYAQRPKEPIIATHMHSPSHIIAGFKENIPIILMIRNPKDCILSYRSFMIKHHNKNEQTYIQLDLDYLVKYYISFYEKLLPYKDKIVISDFNDTINNFDRVIRKLNERNNTSFKEFDNSSESKEYIFKNFGEHLSPSSDRDKLKAILSQKYEAVDIMLRQKAESIYSKMIT